MAIDVWQRMEDAVLNVKRRLEKASAALQKAEIPFAVVGGNAIAAWVATVDIGAVRNTRNVDMMVRRADFDQVRSVLESAGFLHHRVAGVDLFLDGPEGRASDAVHLIFAGEMVRPHELGPNPDVDEDDVLGGVTTLSLFPLVQIKLTAFRRKDQVHLLDLIQVGLVDATWTSRLPEALAVRLQTLLDDPEG